MSQEEELLAVIHRTVGRVPEWLRSDLTSRDEKVRSVAEETLAKIVTAALMDAGVTAPLRPPQALGR